MAFDVNAARNAGYSEQEIAEYLGQQNKFDAAGAIKAGYNPAELIDYLSKQGPKKSTIGSELVGGAKRVISSGRSGIGSIFTPEESAKAGVARSEAIAKEAGEGASFEALKRAYEKEGLLGAAKELPSQIPRALAGQAANLALMYGGAKTGAALGTAVAPGAGTIVGGVLGAGATLLPQFMGQTVETQAAEQMEKGEPVKIDRTKAYTAAAGMAALESAGTAFTLGKRVVKGILGVADDAAIQTAKAQAELVKAAERSLAASAGRGAARGMVDIPVEVGQEIINRYQSGQDLTSPEAIKAYGESAYQAALIGAPLGGAAGAVGRGSAREQLEQQRAAESQAEQERIASRGAQLPPEAPVGTQGALFSEEEMGKRIPTPKEEPAAQPTPAAPQGEQLGLGLDFQRDYADIVKERETLKQQPQTPDVKARVAELNDMVLGLHEQEVASIRAEKQAQAELQEQFPGLSQQPAQASLFPEIDVVRPEAAEMEQPRPTISIQQEEARRRLQETQDQEAADIAQKEQERKGGQYRLPLRTVPEDRNVNRNLPIPARPTEITMQDLEDIGVPMRTSQKWMEQNVIGKTPAEIQVLVGNNPDLLLGTGSRAQILKYLTAPVPEGFKEETRVPTPTKTNLPKPRPQPGRGEPSVGVPSELTSAELVQPRARVSAPARTPAAPDRLRLAPAGQPVSEGVDVTGEAQPTLNAPATTPAVTPPIAPAAPVAQPSVAAKPTPKAPVAKKGKAPAPDVAPEAVEIETAEQEAARKAEAEEMRRALEAPTAKPAPKIAAPAPKAEKPAPKELPEKLREPIGTSEFGMEEGEKEIQRGPQGMLFPMSKREEIEYAERKQSENDKKEEVEAAPKADTRQMELVFPPDAEAIVKAVNGKTILEAANWGAKNFPDADQRMIAMRVAATLRELQAIGVTMGTFKVTNEGDRLTSGAKGVAIMQRGPNNTPSTIRITVNHPSNGDQSGADPEGILHELIHAATMGAIEIGNKKSAVGTRIGNTVGELYDVVNAVFAHVDAKFARGETLNETEKKLRTPYMRDVDEVLAWTLTNRDMQTYMETVPYKNSNLWTKFVESVRKVLGLTPKADTALSEILRVGGELTSMTAADLKQASTATGKQFSKSYTAQDIVDSMGPLTPVNKRGLKEMIVGTEKEGDPSRGVKFRVAAADSAAAIEEKFSRTFNGAVRDSMGKINPMGLYRQAQDYSKILLEYFQKGTLTKDKETGLYRTIGKGEGAPADIFPLIYAWGKKTGRTNEQAEQFASRVLEAKRLDEVLKVNPDFPKHIPDRERAILVAEYNSDSDFAKMNAAMDKPRLALIDKMVDVGRLSKEKAEEWKSVIGYVPFDRINKFDEKFYAVKKTSGRSPLMLTKDPELVGSFDRPVGNVFENYLNTMGWMVGQVMNNDARIQTLRGLEDLGFAKFTRGVKSTENRSAKAFVDGEVVYWELPSEYDAAAFQDLNPPKMAIFRTLGAFSNILRKSVTILPPFALKQVTDDVQRAMLTSGVKNPGALLRMSLANFGKLAVAELRGIQHPIVKEFGALGLTGEYDFEQGKPAVSLLKDLGYRERGRFETILHRLDGITRASDLAVRKAIYDQTLEETNKDRLLAQTRAREFINFRRRGASELIAVGTATIPFFNAYVQGMDVLYRAASGKDSSSSVGRAQARQLFWSRAGTVAALSTLYALMAGDDEDYKDMDLRTRNGNWILPGGYKIPVPGELGAIFKVIPETVVEYLRRSGTPEEQTALEAIRASLKYMSEQYIERTVPIPQAVKPLIEAWTNYSFFTGRELEGIYQKQQDPSMRTTSRTSELAQAISNFSRDVIGVDAVSPIQIDNMLNGYFGSTAALVTMTTDSLLNPSRIDRPLHKYALLSNYLYDPVGTRSLTEFYDEREKVGKANNTLRQLMKTDIDRAVAYADAHKEELALESAMNSTLEQLERTRAYRKFLNSPDGAKDMSKEERESELIEIKKMEVELTGWLREAKNEIRKAQ
jgi:hypothetical protein